VFGLLGDEETLPTFVFLDFLTKKARKSCALTESRQKKNCWKLLKKTKIS